MNAPFTNECSLALTLVIHKHFYDYYYYSLYSNITNKQTLNLPAGYGDPIIY
jgi:hypothetical protein